MMKKYNILLFIVGCTFVMLSTTVMTVDAETWGWTVAKDMYCCIACNKGDVLVRKDHAYYLNEHKFIVGYQTVLLRSFSIW